MDETSDDKLTRDSFARVAKGTSIIIEPKTLEAKAALERLDRVPYETWEVVEPLAKRFNVRGALIQAGTAVNHKFVDGKIVLTGGYTYYAVFSNHRSAAIFIERVSSDESIPYRAKLSDKPMGFGGYKLKERLS